MEPSLQSVARLPKAGIDLGFFGLSDPPDAVPGNLVAIVEIGIFIAPDHPAVQSWRAASSAPLPMLMPLSQSPVTSNMARSLAAAKINYEVTARAQYGEMLMNMAIHGHGACCLPVGIAAKAVRAGKLIQLEAALSPIYRYVFRRTGKMSTEIGQIEEFFSSLLRA